MENDQNSSQSAADTPAKPGRSKLERLIVWGLIGLLLVFTGVEALSKNGYEKTLEELQAAIDGAKGPITLDQFKGQIKQGLPVQSVGEHDGHQTILFTWPSLFKTYHLHFTVSPDGQGTLVTYATGTDPAAVIRSPPPDGEVVEEPMEMPEGMGAGSAGVGMGNQASGGAGGRRGGRNPFAGLISELVLAELQTTDDQKAQLTELVESQQIEPMISPEERAERLAAQRKSVDAKIKEILNEQQYARAKQVLLHSRGPEALTDDEVVEKLGLSQEQRDQIAAVMTSQAEKQQSLTQQADGGGIDGSAMREKRQAINDERNALLVAVLTAEQKQAWEELLGPAPPQPERRRPRPE